MRNGHLTYCEIESGEDGGVLLGFYRISAKGSPLVSKIYMNSVEEIISWCDDVKAIAVEKLEYDKIISEQSKQQQKAEEEREQLRQRLKQAQKEKALKMKQIKAQQQEIKEPTLF